MSLDPKIAGVFDAVLDLSREQRVRYFEDNCIDPEIRREVESLLSFDEADTDVLEDIVRTAVGLSSFESRVPREACGPYRLVRLLGRGGMGAVYLAERIDGEVRQQVAVKLVHAGFDSIAARRRFQQERQILADLSHPNVARLIDAGRCDDGQPYLVMEYVDGTPIDEYCSTLPVRTRVELLLGVCDAVSSAHQKLVIHRDLKPANIMVDGSGTPKLLDFGIAKLLEAGDEVTATIERRLTPAYASPEQIRGNAIGTPTDIYSLGAVLYKLLTGRTPFYLDGGATLASIEMAVCEKDVVPPSTIVPRIGRDLDAIVLKAMRKEPQARYATVDQFADDIRAWLEHRPVRARQGDLWYLTRRTLRRYWVPVTAATVAITGLSVGLFFAVKERNLAQRRFLQVRRLSGELFNVESDINKLPGATPARERIVRTSLDYLEQLSKDAGNDLDLKSEIALGYRKVAEVQGVFRGMNLGHPEEARANLRKADSLFREVRAARPNDRDALRNLIEVVEVESRTDFAERRMKELEARIAELHRLLAVYEPPAKDDAEVIFLAKIYNSVAIADRELAHVDEAASLSKRSADLLRDVVRRTNSEEARGTLANILETYSRATRAQGDLEASLKGHLESTSLLEEIARKDPQNFKARLNIANSYLNVARVLGDENGASLGRTDEAIPYFERGLQIGREVMAADPSENHVRYNHSIGCWRYGDAIRSRDPKRALAAYDEGIGLLRGMPAGTFSRDVPLAVMLAESTFALRALNREPEARQRLKEAKDVAAPYTVSASPAYMVSREAISRAEADWALSSGRAAEAIALHRAWLDSMYTVKPAPADDVKRDLSVAFLLTRRYALLATSARAAGDPAQAAEADAKRREIARWWTQKLPGNKLIEPVLLR